MIFLLIDFCIFVQILNMRHGIYSLRPYMRFAAFGGPCDVVVDYIFRACGFSSMWPRHS